MHRKFCEADVGDGDRGSYAANRLISEEVVEEIVREIDLYASFAFIGNGADEEARAEEELEIQGESVRVVWVEKPHGVKERGAIDRLVVEGRVEVIKELIASLDCASGSVGDNRPAVEFLVDDADGVVVSIEGVPGSQGSPASTELRGSITSIATDVGAYHGHLVDCSEGKHLRNRNPIMGPV